MFAKIQMILLDFVVATKSEDLRTREFVTRAALRFKVSWLKAA